MRVGIFRRGSSCSILLRYCLLTLKQNFQSRHANRIVLSCTMEGEYQYMEGVSVSRWMEYRHCLMKQLGNQHFSISHPLRLRFIASGITCLPKLVICLPWANRRPMLGFQ